MCASYCSSSRTIVALKATYRTISILKVAFKVLLTTDDEVELTPEHGGVDDDGHRHYDFCIIIGLGFICFQLSSSSFFFDL